MKKAFVTYLGTADFLPGLLVLNQSLIKNNNYTDLIILVTHEIGAEIIYFLKNNFFNFKIIDAIENPYNGDGLPENRYRYNYSKLRIFELTEYDKIVYLDADLLVCECIENLFDKPHMSGTIAGGIIAENRNWNKINSGVLVVEPCADLFEKMKMAIKILPSSTKGDQGFLHSYYPDWENQFSLHLEHSFNIPAPYIDEYCATGAFSFNYHNKQLYAVNVAIIHFWGRNKPWHYGGGSTNELNLTKYNQAINLWWDYFDSIVEEE